MKKFAYLTSQYPATSHTFIRREVQALREGGVDLATFSIRTPSKSERADPENQDEFERTGYVLPTRPARLLGTHLRSILRRPRKYVATLRDATRHRVPGSKALVWSIFHFAEAIQLARDLEEAGVHHVHNHFANSSATVGYLASRFGDLDFSLTLHGISEFDYPAGLLLKEKIEHAKFVACVSHFGRAQALRGISPADWEKLCIVRCGIETEKFRGKNLPGAKSQSQAGAPLRLLHVGRLSPEKGQVGLVQAFAKVRAQGIDAELRLVGDGPLESELRSLIKSLSLEEHCHLVGRKAEQGVIDELAEADAFVLASFMEGLPVVIMEALAAGVPVVAPCVAGIPELTVHGESGLLFAPGDWHDLASQMTRLLTDEKLRERLAVEGRRRVLDEFAIEKAVEPLLERFLEKNSSALDAAEPSAAGAAPSAAGAAQ